jgi:hypothetical protein
MIKEIRTSPRRDEAIAPGVSTFFGDKHRWRPEHPKWSLICVTPDSKP